MYGKQKAFLDSDALFRSYAGGIGSGKSWVGAYDLIRRAKANRLYTVVAPTYSLMADASFRSVENIARELDLIAHIARGKPPYIKLKTGAEILFRSGDEPDMLRGPNLSGTWLDEASLMKQEVYDVMIGRLREAGELGWLTATFTPQGKAHWTYKTFGMQDKPDTELFHARTDENPFLPAGFVESRRRQYTAKHAEQELGGVFLDDGGNFFTPGTWPRFDFVGEDAFRIRLSNSQGHVYHRNECLILLTLDWALNKVKRNATQRLTADKTDFNAFIVSALTKDSKLFILDCVNERIKPEGKAPALAALCRRWRPFVVAGDDDAISETLLLDCRRYPDIPEIRCLPISGKDKRERATAAMIRGENGLIYLPNKDEPWKETFCDQVSSFNGLDDEHDDIVDALGIQGRLADQLKGTGHPEAVPEVLIPGRDLFGW